MEMITFLIQGPDQIGLVSEISTFFYKRGFNIVDCQEHVDITEKQYFMRIQLSQSSVTLLREELETAFAELGKSFQLAWSVHYSYRLPKVAILCTKAPHCLYDLLVRHEQKELPCEIPLIISNHARLESVAEKFKVPFHCLPIEGKEDKSRQEQEVQELLHQKEIDLVVLARYMQILSSEFIEANHGRIINIHHAFLPAFQGANPYLRAFKRGVKMIGATAHYATPELDEGPIIEQDVERVNHGHSSKQLTQIGADIERIVLARAVKAHLEHRIIVYSNKTVVFN